MYNVLHYIPTVCTTHRSTSQDNFERTVFRDASQVNILQFNANAYPLLYHTTVDLSVILEFQSTRSLSFVFDHFTAFLSFLGSLIYP